MTGMLSRAQRQLDDDPASARRAGSATSRRPSTVLTRWASPDRPLPPGSAPPPPSSVTLSRSRSPRPVARRPIRLAELCLAALASSSAAQK
jgi:hypothetical protein